MPIVLVPRALLSLLSLLILAAGVYLVWSWLHGYDVRHLERLVLQDGLVRRETIVRHLHGSAWRLWVGMALLGWSCLGRFVVLACLPAGEGEPRGEAGEARVVAAPDGSSLHMESFGRVDAPTLILTHGWGLDSTVWGYARKALGGRFRLVTWDLPGLGRSSKPVGGAFSIDAFAQALGAIVEASGAARVVLVGHSIGGMTTQTLWRACPAAVKARVAGLVLIDTTHEDPVQTMWLAPLWRALKAPLIKPMMGLTIALSPLVWLSSWQSYLSGSSQIAMRLTGFGRFATRGQVDLTARLSCKGSPAVQARGNLAMLRWRVTEALAGIETPVLVISGDKDIVTLPAAGEAIARATPRGRFLRVEGCGHMGFLERHDAYDEAIAEFAAPLLAVG